VFVPTLAGLLAGCGGGSTPTPPAATTAAGTTPGGTTATPPTGTSSPPPAAIQVTSTAFATGAMIPSEFTCKGAGEAPPLAWTGTGQAAAVALVVDDPDAPGGTFVHWVVLDLPAGSTGLPRGGALPAGVHQATNSGGGTGWVPPCPPSDTHHYRFTVYALSAPTGLADGVDKAEAATAIERLATAHGQLVGLVSSS
jgi:Raf kinase inhibitor-like YbhB/YbcL family protein